MEVSDTAKDFLVGEVGFEDEDEPLASVIAALTETQP